MLKNWLKIAFKNYRKNWVSTLINLFGLTVGLTGFMLIMLHWNDEASYESWVPEKENIYFLQQHYITESWTNSNMSYLMVSTAVEDLPDLEDYLLFGYSDGVGLFKTKKGKAVYIKDGMGTSESFFKFFPFKLKYGSYENALSDENKMAISSELSYNLFGDENPVGEEITFQDKKYMITNVYELPKSNTVVKPNYLLLSSTLIGDRESIKKGYKPWGNNSYQTLVKVKSGVDISKIEKDIFDKVLVKKRYSKELLEQQNATLEEVLEKWGPNQYFLTKLDETRLHAKARFRSKGDYKTIRILFGLSILILTLSAINFINLKTAQASQRAKEVGVRKAIGSSKSKIIRQFIFETAIVCTVAYLLSLICVELFLPTFNKFLNKTMVLNNPDVFIYSVLGLIILILLSGIVPAIYLSKFKPINTLKGNFSRSKSGVFLRNGILGLQIIISSFFIIGSLIVSSQVKHIMNRDLGFNGKQVINIWFNDGNHDYVKYERLRTEISKIQGVEEVTFGEASPNQGGSSSNIDWKDKSITAQHGAMDYNYLDFFEIPIIKGRKISSDFSSDTISNILVNETFVNQMGWELKDVLNKEVKPGFDNINYKIIGVVKDYSIWNATGDVPPIILFHYFLSSWKRDNMYFMQVKLNEKEIEASLARIKDFWESKAEPNYPFEYQFIDKEFAKTFVSHQKQQLMYNTLNIIVLLVALLGLFALSALMIEQKLKTVAIKKTLGASDRSLIFGLTKQFLTITAVAVLISIPISYYFMNEWLKDFAYRIEMPWFPYVLSFVILQILTFVVVSIKAYRATQISLVKYLKHE